MSEISDEEVDYGSFESIVNPATDSDHVWSTSEIDSQHLREKGILINTLSHKSRDKFAVHEGM